jgi:hypothetical protein
MRPHATVESAAGLAPFGHMGWGFHHRSEFLARAAEYIADGIRQNQLVAYVGEADEHTLRSELDAMPALAGLDVTTVNVISAADYYVYQPGTDVLDAEAALGRYIATAQDAVHRGYTGFRAVVDVTAVARTATQRESLAELEFLVDQQMAVLPFSALCAYNVTQLGTAAKELLCLHPYISAGSVSFQLFADPEPEVDFALTGELDAFTQDVFTTTLGRIWPLTAGTTLHVDARELTFVDHRSLITLSQVARRHSSTVVLHTDHQFIGRILDLLDVPAVRVQAWRGTNFADAISMIEQVTVLLTDALAWTSADVLPVLRNLSEGSNIAMRDLAAQIRDDLAGDSPGDQRQARLDTLLAVRDRLA